MHKSPTALLGVLALALMILLPSLVMVKALQDRANGTIWQVDITGYDPRDLLYGHYMQFRYDWNFPGETEEDGRNCPYHQSCCLCLTEAAPGSNVNPLAEIVDCQAPQARQCKALVTGKKGRNQFLEGQKFFVPQEHGTTLETLLRGDEKDFKMEIAVPHSGGPAIIRNLYIDQLPLGEFLLKAQEQR